jgi:hypothetical protein
LLKKEKKLKTKLKLKKEKKLETKELEGKVKKILHGKKASR